MKKNVVKFKGKPVSGPRLVRDEPALIIILPIVRIEHLGCIDRPRRKRKTKETTSA